MDKGFEISFWRFKLEQGKRDSEWWKTQAMGMVEEGSSGGYGKRGFLVLGQREVELELLVEESS